jgi:Holliday junction resolvase RusA-like endonuclease
MTPVPQKQTQFVNRGGKMVGYNPCSNEIQQVRWQIRPQAPVEPLTGALAMELIFYLPIPKGTSLARRKHMLANIILPTKRPDVDNLAYLVTNALKDLVYADDSQLVDIVMRKRYGEIPKTVIKIIPVDEIAKSEFEPYN